MMELLLRPLPELAQMLTLQEHCTPFAWRSLPSTWQSRLRHVEWDCECVSPSHTLFLLPPTFGWRIFDLKRSGQTAFPKIVRQPDSLCIHERRLGALLEGSEGGKPRRVEMLVCVVCQFRRTKSQCACAQVSLSKRPLRDKLGSPRGRSTREWVLL